MNDLIFIKHTICEFVFKVDVDISKKEILLYNCICPKCKKELKDKYVIMAKKDEK